MSDCITPGKTFFTADIYKGKSFDSVTVSVAALDQYADDPSELGARLLRFVGELRGMSYDEMRSRVSCSEVTGSFIPVTKTETEEGLSQIIGTVAGTSIPVRLNSKGQAVVEDDGA